MSQTATEHRDPLEILDELSAIETEIGSEIDALKVSLRENIN